MKDISKFCIASLILSSACIAQTSYFVGGSLGLNRGFGFTPFESVAIAGVEGKTPNWYWHTEFTVDPANKVTAHKIDPATAYRVEGEFSRRFGPHWYAGVGESATYLDTHDYDKVRQNGRITFGYLGSVFASHAAYVLPLGNPERVQGGEYVLDYTILKHLTLTQKYGLYVCKACIDEFHERYLIGGIAYGAQYRF